MSRPAFQLTALSCGAFVIIALLATFQQFTFSYFWWDDINNFYLAQRTDAWDIAWHIVNPLALSPPESSFRPLGMFFYRLFWVAFDLDPLPYRLFQWGIHSANVLLIYLLLKELLRSRFAAACGAALFVYQAIYFELYWNFWAIFELLSAFFLFLALLIYLRRANTVRGMLLVSLAYLLGNQAKEMAITLPAILILAELTVGRGGELLFGASKLVHLKTALVREKGYWRDVSVRLLLPVLICLIFIYAKLTTFAGMQMLGAYDPTFPYYRNYSPSSLAESYAWYFNALLHTQFETLTWLFAVLSCAGLLIFLRERIGLFFLGYILISFLPVVILPNHRFGYYWYVPSLGVAGLIGTLLRPLPGKAAQWLPSDARQVFAAEIVGLICAGNFLLQSHLDRFSRAWAAEVAMESRSFMEGLRTLPQPSSHETVYFDSVPRYFAEVQTKSATQVAFRRTDLEIRIVQEFPPESKYRISFRNLIVRKEP